MSERNERLLATIRKNAREEIHITRGPFKGHDVISVRVWFLHCSSGEMRPSKDGLAFRAELVDEIIEALRGREGWGAMSARRKEAAPQGVSESTIYLDRHVAGIVIVEQKGRVVATDASGKRIGVYRTDREAMAAILAAARAERETPR